METRKTLSYSEFMLRLVIMMGMLLLASAAWATPSSWTMRDEGCHMMSTGLDSKTLVPISAAADRTYSVCTLRGNKVQCQYRATDRDSTFGGKSVGTETWEVKMNKERQMVLRKDAGLGGEWLLINFRTMTYVLTVTDFSNVPTVLQKMCSGTISTAPR